MRRYIPPEAYHFLLAAGEIDFLSADSPRAHLLRCAEELERLARMNGEYANLPADFRADMQRATGSKSDRGAASSLGALAKSLRSIDSLEGDARAKVRAQCSLLSRVWPLKQQELLLP